MSNYPVSYPRNPQVNPWIIRLPILFISGVVLFLAAIVVLVMAFEYSFSNQVVPGMSAYGVNLGGMTREQAAQALSAAFTYDDKAVFTFRYGDKFWQVTAGDLGIGFDVNATVDEAFSAGHSSNVMSDLVSQASIWLNGRSVAPIVKYDQNITIQKLGAIAAELNRPAVDATINLDGTLVSSTPSQTGRALDINGTLSRLEEALLQLNTGAEIPLVVNESLPLVTDASAAVLKIQTALSGPITLVTDDQKGGSFGPWTATPDQIRPLLALSLVTNADGTQSYDVDVNVEAFRAFVQSLAPGLISLPKDGRFHFNLQTQQLEPIKESVNGRALDVDTTLQRMREGIFSTNNRIVSLAYTYTLPAYSANVSASELGITELVGEATTYYTGSTQSRVTNIIEAVGRFDGLIIAPGFPVWGAVCVRSARPCSARR